MSDKVLVPCPDNNDKVLMVIPPMDERPELKIEHELANEQVILDADEQYDEQSNSSIGAFMLGEGDIGAAIATAATVVCPLYWCMLMKLLGLALLSGVGGLNS